MYKPLPKTPLTAAVCVLFLIWTIWFLEIPTRELFEEYRLSSLTGDKGGGGSAPNEQLEPPVLSTPISTNDRPLILYAYSESETARANLKYFLAHGIHGAADFVFIFNGESNATALIPEKENIKYIERRNDCYDLGAYAEILTRDNLYKMYRRFIMLNASLRGPFLPSWAESCWSDLYLSKLSATVKLVGMTANCWPSFHIQSMIWATDIIGLETLLFPSKATIDNLPEMPQWKLSDKHGSNEPEDHPAGINSCFHTWNAAVNAEIKATAVIKAAGYEVDALMSAFHGMDHGASEGSGQGDHHRHHPNGVGRPEVALPGKMGQYEAACDSTKNGDVLRNGRYFGTNVHPFETLFMKTNRDVDPILIDRLSSWMDGSGFSSYDYCKA